MTNTNDSGAGSLRQKIEEAAPGDTIVFEIPRSDPRYDHFSGLFGITLAGAPLVIAKDLTIDGTDSKIILSGDTKSPVFDLTAGTVRISKLSIYHGWHSSNGGGGIGVRGAVLVLKDCLFVNNGGRGGALTVETGSSATVTNCTFHANAGSEAAVFNAGTLDLRNSTLSFNFGGIHSGGLVNTGTMRVRSCIIAGNFARAQDESTTPSDVKGAFVSEGYNFIGVNFSSFGTGFGEPGSHDQVGTSGSPKDPQLNLLLNNGGPTWTLRPVAGSPVIDQGDRGADTAGEANADGRGFARPSDQPAIPNAGDGSDIGAVEVGVPQTGSAFTVTTTYQTNDGFCETDHCTFLEALNASNENADASTIGFGRYVAGTTFTTIDPAGFTLAHPLTINGPGARLLSLHGGDDGRLLRVPKGSTVTISGLTLTHGKAPGGGFPANSGGAILNEGNLTISDCAFTANRASAVGGAIFNNGTNGTANLTVFNSTFASNSVDLSGGAIFSSANGGRTTMALTNCTLYSNNAAQHGGAIYNDGNANGNAALTLTNCTFDNNTATLTASGIYNDAVNPPDAAGTATVTLRNTILRSGDARANLVNDSAGGGTITSGGSNLSSDAAGGGAGAAPGGFLNAAGDKRNTDPVLGPFGSWGGQTDTSVLIFGSPAIDAGNDANAPERDQRRFFRTGVSDIGAFEFSGVAPMPPGVTTSAATNIGTTSATLNAVVDPNRTATTFQFKADFGTFELKQAGSGDSDVPFSVTVSGLSPNTTYHFSAVATNEGGRTEGARQTFTTLPETVPPTPTPVPTATPVPTPTPVPNRFANISTRVRVETGANGLFGGFIVSGSQQKKIIVRAIGPSLPVEDRLANPLLELYNGNGELIGSNDNWQEAENAQEIMDSTVAPSNELESAILRDVQLGAYTAQIRDVADGEGVALVEVYDLGAAQNSKLANIATRGRIQTGENIMIAGLIISGSSPQKVIVRAIGPSLQGVEGRLEDPVLELYDRFGVLMTANNNWRDTQEAEVATTTIPPSHDLESAIVAFLPPDLYTAQVRGAGDTTGVAIVEVYALE